MNELEFKGTKGEWEFEGGDNNSIDIVLPDGTTISVDRQCRYTGDFVLSREGMIANAKLIAAAPELLEALQGLLNITNDSDGVSGYHLNGNIATWGEFEEIKAAYQAIEKALK